LKKCASAFYAVGRSRTGRLTSTRPDRQPAPVDRTGFHLCFVRKITGSNYGWHSVHYCNDSDAICANVKGPVYTIQPVVKPVVQPVWQPCKRGKRTSNDHAVQLNGRETNHCRRLRSLERHWVVWRNGSGISAYRGSWLEDKQESNERPVVATAIYWPRDDPGCVRIPQRPCKRCFLPTLSAGNLYTSQFPPRTLKKKGAATSYSISYSSVVNVCVPLPLIDIIWAVTIVWRIRGKITNCSVLCCVRQLYTMIRTHTSSSYTV